MGPRSVTRRAEDDSPTARTAYVEAVLAIYRAAPGVLPHTRKADVRLAGQLHDRGVSLQTVNDAMAVALCRRLVRSAPPTEPVRSLHYFLGVIEELEAGALDPDYVLYLRACLRRHLDRTASSR